MKNSSAQNTPNLPESEKTQTTKRKKKKRPPALTAAIAFVSILIVVLITLAMFTSFDEVTNVFAGGNVDIVLTEPSWKPNKALNIVPETVLDKDPYITNNEDTLVYVFLEVTVPYGTFEIEDNSTNNQGSALAASYTDAPLYKFGVTDNSTTTFNTDYNSPAQNVNAGWILLDSDSNGYTSKDETNNVYKYVYAHVQVGTNGVNTNALSPLAQGVTTQKPLFNKIKLVNFDETNTEKRDYSVTVKAYGIQANFLKSDNSSTNNPAEVWNILNS